jgi:hypothetical protein
LPGGHAAQRSYCANSGAALNEYTSIRDLSFVIFHFWNLVTHPRVCQEILEAG